MFNHKAIILILLVLFLLVPIICFALNQNLYVTESGAGVHDGKSWASAWSVANLNSVSNWDTINNEDKIDPGDTVNIDGIITSMITLAGSGNGNNKIFFDLTTAHFQGGYGHLTAIRAIEKDYFTLLGGEFANQYTTNALNIISGKNFTISNPYMHDLNKIGIWITGADGRDSDNFQILNPRFENMTTVNAWCIRLEVAGGTGGGENGTVHDFEIKEYDASNIYGFLQFYGSNAIVYPNGDETINKAIYNFLIEDGTVDTTVYGGIITSGGCKAGSNIIRKSKFANIGEPTMALVNAIQLNNCDNILVEYIEVSNTQASNSGDGNAIILDYKSDDDLITQDAVIRYCYIHDNINLNDGKGINFYKSVDGKAYGNILSNNSTSFKNNTVQSTGNLVYNNTINNSVNHDLYVGAGSLTFKNNIINGTPTVAHILKAAGATLISDYNDLYPDTGTLFNFEGTMYNFTDWKTNSSQDSHSINLNPLFVSPLTNNYHLCKNSPCIDAGIDVGLTEDYEGNPIPLCGIPDIGAYESRCYVCE